MIATANSLPGFEHREVSTRRWHVILNWDDVVPSLLYSVGDHSSWSSLLLPIKVGIRCFTWGGLGLDQVAATQKDG